VIAQIGQISIIFYKQPSDIDKFTVVLVNEEMGY